MDRWKIGQRLGFRKQGLTNHSQGNPPQFSIIVHTLLDLNAVRECDWMGRAEHLEYQSFCWLLRGAKLTPKRNLESSSKRRRYAYRVAPNNKFLSGTTQ